MDRLQEMLEMQEDLQRRHNAGLSPASFGGLERAIYIRVHMLALEDELHEALREIAWKPWSQRSAGEMNRDKYLDEMIDAWHFFMNLLIVADCTPEEFFTRYLRKNNINHDRIDDGYVSPTG